MWSTGWITPFKYNSLTLHKWRYVKNIHEQAFSSYCYSFQPMPHDWCWSKRVVRVVEAAGFLSDDLSGLSYYFSIKLLTECVDTVAAAALTVCVLMVSTCVCCRWDSWTRTRCDWRQRQQLTPRTWTRARFYLTTTSWSDRWYKATVPRQVWEIVQLLVLM